MLRHDKTEAEAAEHMITSILWYMVYDTVQVHYLMMVHMHMCTVVVTLLRPVK